MAAFLSPLVIFLSLNIMLGNGAKVEFYSEPDFKGSMSKFNSSSTCYNLPSSSSGRFNGSLKTTGCISVHDAQNCPQEGRATWSYLIKSEESRLADLSFKYEHYDFLRGTFLIKSFKDCSSMESRVESDLDFFEHPNNNNNVEGKVVEFRDVCTCTQLPIQDKNMHRIYTYGNCFKFYFSMSDCRGDAFDMSPLLRPQQTSGIAFKPCHLPLHCLKLKATIVKLEPLANISNDMEGGEENQVAMATNQIFINNGNTTLEENYQVSKEIFETAQLEVSSEILRENSVISLEAGVLNGVEESIPFVGELLSKLEAAMMITMTTFQTTTQQNPKETGTFLENMKVYEIQRKISVPPCTKYEVSSFVEMSTNVEIEYRVQVRILGELGYRQNVGRDEIIESLKEKHHLTYLYGDFEEYNFTVVAETSAKLKLSFGRHSEIIEKGEPIFDCFEKFKKLGCM